MDYLHLQRILFREYNIYIVCGLIIGLLCAQTDSTRSPCNQKTHFPCRTTPHICIELSRVRDGRTDCPDGSDEECPEDMYRCRCGIPRCIHKNKLSDGISDCQDGSDEGEDGSNFLCPESFDEEDPLSIEMKKRRRRHSGMRNDPVVYPSGIISAFIGTEVNGDRTTFHTTQLYRTYIDGTYTELLQSTSALSPTPTLDNHRGMESTALVHRFGSLNSGKVYLTAVNEPVSSMSSSVVEREGAVKISGTFLPPNGEMATKHFGLDIAARTIGTLYPDKTESSIIVVTGTAGAFVQRDHMSEATYPVYTGSYISGLEDPTTYKFFFGNQPLTSNVKVILPTKTIDIASSSEKYLAEESELQGSLTRRNDIDEESIRESGDNRGSKGRQYRATNSSKELYASVSTIRPAAVTRYVQPSAYPETNEAVLAVAGDNTIGVIGNIRKSQAEHTLRGHQGYSRQGRMYNPSPTGRRVGQGGATIITDQFFFPGHRIETSIVGDPSDAYYKDIRDISNAYYDVNNFSLRDELRKIVRPTVVKDKRLTRTVGLYGPIYEVDDLKTDFSVSTTADETSFNTKTSSDQTDNEFTTTLYGFAEFSTLISGTHYIFLPASTRPRTFTPRVTRTSFSNGISSIPRTQSDDKTLEMQPEAFFRKPLFGTETREFISQKSMFTSTVKEPIEIQKTMFTSTVMTKQYSEDQTRGRKMDDISGTIVAETLPLNLATVYSDDSDRTTPFDEKDTSRNFNLFSKHTLMTEDSLDISEIIDEASQLENLESHYPTGLVSSITGTEISDGTTTHWKTLIYGTYIDDTYAHIIESTSSIFFTVSKTASPEETLAITEESASESQINSELVGTSRNSNVLLSSIREISPKSDLTLETLSSNVATPKLEILTSGFILPNSEDKGSSSTLNFPKTTSIVSDELTSKFESSVITPSVIYADIPESSLEESFNSITNDVAHILTDSFILPDIVETSSKLINDISGTESIGERTTIDSTIATDKNFVSSDEEIRGLEDSTKGVTEISIDEETIINLLDVKDTKNVSENDSTLNETDIVPSVVLLTGDFILPLMSTAEDNDVSNENIEETKVITDSKPVLDSTPVSDNESLFNTPSIITDGFILPGEETSSLTSETKPTVMHVLPSSALLTADIPNEIDARSAGDEEKIILIDSAIRNLSSSPKEDRTEETERDQIIPDLVETRTAKSLVVTSDDTSYPNMEEILPSIVFPITYYTTSTYFTTYLSDGIAVVSSRKETVSNVYTDNDQLRLAKLNPTETVIMPNTILPSKTVDLTDDLTTFTYFNTFYKDGSKIVSSREETKSGAFDEVSTQETEIKPSYSILTYPTTYYTTLTYFTTLLEDTSTKVITNKAVISNIVTPSFDNGMNVNVPSIYETDPPNSITATGAIPTTYYTTYTYFTTFHKDGTTSVSTTYKTVSNVFHGSEPISSTPSALESTSSLNSDSLLNPTDHLKTFEDDTSFVSNREEVSSSTTDFESTPNNIITKRDGVVLDPQKTTFYTTYTYYTTILKEGSTSVITRKETISNILDGSIKSSTVSSMIPTAVPSADITSTPSVKTYFTTYTYYTTYLRDGSPVISTREDTLTNFVTENLVNDLSTVAVTPTRSFTTYYTTLTSYYTLYYDGTPSVNTVFNTLTDVVALSTSLDPQVSITTAPTITTYFKTHTYYTTLYSSGSPIVSTREQVTSRIVTLGETKDPITIAHAVTAFRSEDSAFVQPTSVIKTYYTTYTFFTTYLYKGQPSVSTRLETSTNFVTDTIIPAQTVPSVKPITSSIAFDYSTNILGSLEESNNKILVSSNPKLFPHLATSMQEESNFVLTSSHNSEDSDKLSTDSNVKISRESSNSFNPSNTMPNFPSTVYTTYTFYTTSLINSIPVVNTRYVTSTNVISAATTVSITENVSKPSSDLDEAEGGLHENRVHPTPVVTYYTTHTYIATTINSEGETKYITKQVVASATANPHIKSNNDDEISITQTTQYPYTFYTTYTYYTTRYHGEKPIISTRYETITNVIKAPVTSRPELLSTSENIDIKHNTDVSDVSKTQSINIMGTTTLSIPTSTSYEPASPRDKRPQIGEEFVKLNVLNALDMTTKSPLERKETTVSGDGHNNNQAEHGEILLKKEKDNANSETPEVTENYLNLTSNLDDSYLFTTTSSILTSPETASDKVSSSPLPSENVTSTENLRNESTAMINSPDKLETTEQETTTATEAPKKSIFARRRNRPAYKPRPSFRSSTTTTSPSTAKFTQKEKNTSTRATRSPLTAIRRNTSRILFRRPNSSPRPNPLQRLRPARPTQATTTDADVEETGHFRRRRSFYNVEINHEIKPQKRNLLSTLEEDSNDRITKNNDLISGIEKDTSVKDEQKLGLIRSIDSKVINNGVVTVYGTEIHGTFINGAYAQVVRSNVRIYSDTSNEIEKISVTPTLPPTTSKTLESKIVGLVSSKFSTAVKDGITTVYTTNTYGTYIGDVYAHLAQTTSSVIKPTPVAQTQYPTGLISSITRKDENYGTTTLWTTHIYGTFVNNYYAHIASTFSNIYVSDQHAHPTPIPSDYQKQQFPNTLVDSKLPTPTARSIEEFKAYKTGLLSSIVSEDERDGTTTQYTTNIYGTYIGQHYAKHAKTVSTVITPSHSEPSGRSVGLLSTIVSSIVNQNTATIYKTEILGTYIGQHYAQLARTSTEYKVLQSSPSDFRPSPEFSQRTGLLSSSVIRSEVNSGTTTMHLNEIYGTYIGNAYAHIAKSTSKIIQPTEHDKPRSTPTGENLQKTGLISSSVKTEVNDGVTTLHISEVHGTYVGNYYAHVARRTSTVLPLSLTSTETSATQLQALTSTKSEGLVSSDIKTEVNQGITTLHTREVYGTYINGYYAHVARSTSNIITPTTTSTQLNTGLVSALTSTEINYGTTTLHTTEIFGTRINGFYAHIARSTSSVVTDTPTSVTSSGVLGVISATTSTEINYGVTTLHRMSVIGTEIDGIYAQSIKRTSTIIPTPVIYPEALTTAAVTSIVKSIPIPESKFINLGSAKDDLNTAIVNELDNGNEYVSLAEEVELAAKSISVQEFDLISPVKSEVVVSTTLNQIVPSILTSLTVDISEITISKDLSTQNEGNRTTLSLPETTTEVNVPTKKPEKITKPPLDDYDEYNEYTENKAYKEKDSSPQKPNSREQTTPRKNKTPPISSSRGSELNDDYDDYGFEDDYDDFGDRKSNRKVTPSLTSSQFKNTRQSKRKSTTYNNKDYDEYDDYDFNESDTASTRFSKTTDASTLKETPSSSVRIRPFTGRGRPTYTTTARSSTKASYTIQFRRPSRTRNSRAFGQRSDSENDFDDELNEEDEDDEGDIEASEAIVTTATPQVLSLNRRKPFGSNRQQQQFGRNTGSSTTARPISLGRNRRPFGRSTSSPSPTPALRDSDPDYEENTTEDDDFDEYDDINEKKDTNKYRNFRSTRRPPSRQTRFGERRSASNKRGSFRHREDEETENDDFDTTTPNYRNSRNRINQRKPSRGRYNRNNSPSLKASFNSVNRDEDDDSQSLQPINRIRNNNRNRRPSYNPRTRRPSKTVSETETMRKPYLTVTSVVTTVKTLPIYHGFRTSYATLTTTALDTSIISPTQYSEVISDGITKTLFYSRTGYPDGIENLHTTITEVVVTTTSLASVKLVPIKIGFSTRTDTITDIQVLTTLSTVYSTITPEAPLPTAFPQQFQPNFYPQIAPQNPEFGLVASANSFVTTQIVTSTTVVPIILRGRTILSTLTTTSTAESTVVQTVHIPQSAPNFIPQPYFAFQPLTTLITLYVTGEYGELKPVVTTVTVPLYQQPVFHTKVARSLQQNIPSEHTLKTADIMDLQLMSSIEKDYDVDTHYDQLLSSGLEEINDLSEVIDTNSQTEPLDSTKFSELHNAVTSYDVTTISKGPLTEIYEQKVTINLNTDKEISNKIDIQRSKDTYGLESSYNFRKLQQFNDEEILDYYQTSSNFRPQRDFTRLRRPPAGVILATAANINTIVQPSTQSVPLRNRARQLPPTRRPPIEDSGYNYENSNTRTGFRSSLPRGSLRRPESNFRPFIERPVSVPSNSDNELTPPKETYSPYGSITPVTPVEELVRIRNLQRPPQNLNNNANRFVSSVADDDSLDGFRPISNPPGIRRGPGPAIDDSRTQPELGSRPRRLRITRPVNGLSAPNSGIRRVTRLRLPDVPTPSSKIEEILVTPTVDYNNEEEVLPEILSSEHEILSEDAFDENKPVSSTSDSSSSGETGSRRTVVRRLRPSFVPGDGSGPRRPVVVRRTRHSEHVNSISPSLTEELSSVLGTPVEENTVLSTEPSTLTFDKNVDDIVSSTESNKPPLKKVIRLRKPDNSDSITSGQIRRVIINRRPPEGEITEFNRLQGRGPVSETDISENNPLSGNGNVIIENERNIDDKSRISGTQINSKIFNESPASVFATKPFSLTYYTTLTYFTTFLHGPDTNYVSREAVFSNVIEQTLNPSLINVIKIQSGLISTTGGDGLLLLASRTLGDTTTIVNLASKQNLYNSEVFKLLSDVPIENDVTSIRSSHISITPTKRLNEDLKRTHISEIATLPKTYLTLFTYSYTFFDGVNKRESTRAETMTKIISDPSQFLTESIGSYVNNEGFVTLGPETRVVHLGSREVEGTTTEVNLGLRTWIKFDNVKNVVIETTAPKFQYITPSRTASPQVFTISSTTTESPVSISHIEPSYSIDNELYDTKERTSATETAPLHPSDFDEASNIAVDPKPVVKVTSVIHKPGTPLRSGVFVPRPGVRVRVKPVGSRRVVPSDLATSFDISFDVNNLASEKPKLESSSPQYVPPDLNMGVLPTPVLEDVYLTTVISSDGLGNEIATEDYEEIVEDVASSDGTAVPSRTKLKVTVRRQSESISRTHTRFVLPSRFEITSRPRFYVVTRTGALGVVSNTQRPFTVKISRKVKPSSTEIGLPSTTVIYDTYTTLTSVPVIFGLDTSYRNVLLTTSSPITVSFVPTTAYESDVPIAPSTVVFTYFTTTTFTIPYIDGDQTLLTTLEETNSRIVTQTIDGLDNLSYSTVTRTPYFEDVLSIVPETSVEFGFDGPITHTLSSVLFVPTYQNVPLEAEVTPTKALYETKTFYTTYTFFSTFLAGSEPIVTSSEQVVTNIVTVPLTTDVLQPSSVSPSITGPLTVFDTSEAVVTKTEFNTITFYATLFSDTSSFVTPIEEVETQVKTLTETYTITRTIHPTPSATIETEIVRSTTDLSHDIDSSVVVTQTLYTTFTNFVTLFQGTDTVVTNLEETLSNVVTLTVPAHAASSFSSEPTPTTEKTYPDYFSTFSTTSYPVYTTKQVLSTQTHYLTLFNNDESILSSITEIVTSYITELITPSSPTYIPEIFPTSSSEILLSSSFPDRFSESFTPPEETTETESEIQTYHPELVPSIRTIFSTLTFYTTYYSDTSSIVASQEEVLTSYVTLFVPPSLITSTTPETTTETIQPTSTIDPSVFVFTTTDYSTLTLYTTLFSGDEIVVISSEHVVPEVITATITPSSITPSETSTSDESVLTFLTTFTYYTTYFSGTDPVIASSESVVTQFVTIEAPPVLATSETTIEPTPAVETILGVSTASGGDIISSFKDNLSDIEIIGVSSVVATAVASNVETKIQIESRIPSEIGLPPVILSASLPEIIDTSSPRPDLSSPTKEDMKSPTLSTTTTTEIDSSFTSDSDSKNTILPVTSTSVLSEETELIGIDGKITTLAESDTLVIITGTDGFVTKVPEVSTLVLSPVYIPETVEMSSSTTSEIKPATVIELSDLLGGNTAFGGDIGLTIQDIVSRITGKKNKTDTDTSTTETTTSEPTTQEGKITETTTEESEITVDDSRRSTLEAITESSTESVPDEVDIAIKKDSDYPVFVLPSNVLNDSKTSTSEILAPVYIPLEPVVSLSSEIQSTSIDKTSSESKKTTTEKSHIISTSVITGARTVFIVPTKQSSILESSKDAYSVISSTEKKERIPKLESNAEVKIDSSMTSSVKHTTETTPQLKPSIETSVISGIRTIFFGSSINKGTSTKSSSTSTIIGRANASIRKPKPFTTVTKDGETVISRTTSGATTIFFPGQIPKYTVNPISTRYVTSVESITRTLALTTTRTYYTRDSTLTVPSVYTTTIPPRTFVSTIIGSRTILGILPEPSETVQIHKTLEPSEHTTTVTTTTLIFNSIPSTVIRTLVLPTGIPTKTIKSSETVSASISSLEPQVFNAGTEKPMKPPEVRDSTSIMNEELVKKHEESSETKSTQKVRNETYLRAAGPRIHDFRHDVILEEAIHRPPIVVTKSSNPEDDPFLNGRNGICDPKCQPYKKEICKEEDDLWTCQCRPGHARKNSHEICKEIQTFVVLLKVVKMGNESINFSDSLSDNDSPEYKEFVKSAKEGISDAYSVTNVRDHVWDADVNNIIPGDTMQEFNFSTEPSVPDQAEGVIVNFTLQVSKSVSSDLLKQELARSLQSSSMRIGDSLLLAAPLSQNVQDFDECLDFRQNDCALRATCVNLEGTFTCQCNEGFEDMNLVLPGRICFAKTENCNFCHGRGDCLRDDDDKTFCRCQPMYVGRRCEINGLVLAVALPTAVALVIVLLCVVLCCCRKCKKKSPSSSNNADPGSVFRGIALKGPVEGTLDRKAMIDTSSESSGEHGRKGIPFEGYQESGDVTPYKSSKRSDLSLNRSMSTGYTSPPVMIPRARQPPQTPTKPMNYTVYDGQVYVW